MEKLQTLLNTCTGSGEQERIRAAYKLGYGAGKDRERTKINFFRDFAIPNLILTRKTISDVRKAGHADIDTSTVTVLLAASSIGLIYRARGCFNFTECCKMLPRYKPHTIKRRITALLTHGYIEAKPDNVLTRWRGKPYILTHRGSALVRKFRKYFSLNYEEYIANR